MSASEALAEARRLLAQAAYALNNASGELYTEADKQEGYTQAATNEECGELYAYAMQLHYFRTQLYRMVKRHKRLS